MAKVADVYARYLAPNIQEDKSFDASKKYGWVPDEINGFTKAEILSESGDTVKVFTIPFNEEKTVKKHEVQDVCPAKYDGVQDMSDLPQLNEPCVLYNLRLRYSDDRIHSYSGLFLVVVNPFKNIPIYSDELIRFYFGKRREEVAPHVFAVAEEAYSSMRETKRNQSILITGESGAGKTVNTKRVIQYYASVAASSKRGTGSLEEQILAANPLLEAFGNAKTLRNDNSSRFGKFIQVQFTKAGLLAGASIDHYLLEKSRVCKQNAGERNYHIFYQIFAGSSSAEKASLGLTRPQDFAFINHSGCFIVDEVDDGKELEATRSSMRIMGITGPDEEAILRVVAAVLHLGNVPFGQNSSEEGFAKDKKALQQAAELLRVDAAALEQSLVKKRIKAGTSIVVKNNNEEQASFARDALAKALYGRMFDWIVQRINVSINNDARKDTFIGVLDIAGFEIFENNSLEQLCINFTNEKLQQFFNHHMFKLEQEEYQKEGIKWDFVDFGLDLQDCIDLIEKPGNLLALLDEECVFPKATDLTFLAKLEGKFKDHKNYEKPRLSKDLFALKHYAGKVPYNVKDWLTKNMNPLADDITETLQASKDPFVQGLFWADRSGGARAAGGPPTTAAAGKKAATPNTIVSQYKAQLFSLMSVLGSTEPHFIRCLKPNPEKKPGFLHAESVLDQLRCNGVLEGIRIARKGFPNRIPHEAFKKRFSLLFTKGLLPAEPRRAVETILAHVKADTAQYQIGRSKIFFKAGFLGTLEELREKKLDAAARLLQKAWRRASFRIRLKRARFQKKAAVIVQKNIRSWIKKKNAQWTKLFKNVKPLLKPNKTEEELKEKTKLVDELTAAKTQLESTNAHIQQELTRRIQEIENALKDRERLQGLKTQLEEQVQELKSTLASERSAAVSKEQRSNDHIADLSSRLAAAEERIAQLEKTRIALEGQIADVTAHLEEAAAARLSLEKAKQKLDADLQDTIAQLEAAKSDASVQLKARKKLESELQETNANLSSEKTARATSEHNLATANAELAQLKTDHEKLILAKNSLESNKRQLEAKVADLNGQLEQGDKSRSTTEEAKKKLSREIEELQQQIDDAVAGRTQLEEARRAQDKVLEDTNASLAREKEARAKAEKALQALTSEAQQLRESLETEQATIANLEKAKKKTDADLSQLREDLEAANRAKGVLEQTRKRLESDLREAQDRAEAANKTRGELEETLHEAQQHADDLSNRLDMETKARITLDKAKKQLEGRVDELKDELEQKSTAAKSSIVLHRELELLHDQLEDEISHKQKLETANKQLEAQLAEAIKRGEESARVKIDEIKKNLGADLENAKNKLTEAEEARDNSSEVARKAKAEQKRLEHELEVAQAQQTTTTKANKKLESDLAAATAAVEAEKKLKADAEATAKKLESQLQQLLAEAESGTKARAAIEKAERERRKAEAERDELREQIDDAERATKRVRKDLEAKIEDLKDQLEGESQGIKKAESARAALEQEVARLKKSLEGAATAKSSDEVKALQEQIGDLQAAVEEAGKAKARLEKEKAKLSADLQEVTTERDEAVSGRKSAEKLQKQAEAKLEEATKNTARLQAQVTKLTNELAAAASGVDTDSAEKTRLQKNLKTLEARVKQLQETVDDNESEVTSARSKLRAAEQKLQDLKQEIEDSKEAQKKAEVLLKEAQDSLNELQENADADRLAATKAQSQLKSVQREVADLEEQLAAEQAKVKDEVAKAKRKFQQDIDDLNTKLENELRAKAQAIKTNRLLQRELDDSKSRLEKLLTAGAE